MCQAEIALRRCRHCHNIDLVVASASRCSRADALADAARAPRPGTICRNLRVLMPKVHAPADMDASVGAYTSLDRIRLGTCRVCQLVRRGFVGYGPGDERPHLRGEPVDPYVEFYLLLRRAPVPEESRRGRARRPMSDAEAAEQVPEIIEPDDDDDENDDERGRSQRRRWSSSVPPRRERETPSPRPPPGPPPPLYVPPSPEPRGAPFYSRGGGGGGPRRYPGFPPPQWYASGIPPPTNPFGPGYHPGAYFGPADQPPPPPPRGPFYHRSDAQGPPPYYYRRGGARRPSGHDDDERSPSPPRRRARARRRSTDGCRRARGDYVDDIDYWATPSRRCSSSSSGSSGDLVETDEDLLRRYGWQRRRY